MANFRSDAMFFFGKKDPIVDDMNATLAKLQTRDAATLQRLDAAQGTTLSGMAVEDKRQKAIAATKEAISFAKGEADPDGVTFHSRDALTGITQTHLAKNNPDKGAEPSAQTPAAQEAGASAPTAPDRTLLQKLGDHLLPELQAFGEGNAVVWIPTGVDAILEHFLPKAEFKVATPEKSQITLPDVCKVALLSDWGADNEHAKRLGELAIRNGADYVIHLGDIYYSGAQAECETFVNNWPLKGPDGRPVKGKSFALNGNHEMYSLGRYYFTTVLDGLGQEASYFTLSNDWWQIQGLDTAYVPFSISGGTIDARMKPQWDWLVASIKANPGKKNILLSHNQPVSAHLPEFEQSYPLMQEYWKLAQETSSNAVFAWFFGHEHRCAIYDDTKMTNFKARLIGNGAIPHDPQKENGPDADETKAGCTPFTAVNKGSIDGGPVAISTFALLSFNKGACSVDYINEDGTRFYQTENW